MVGVLMVAKPMLRTIITKTPAAAQVEAVLAHPLDLLLRHLAQRYVQIS